MLTRVHTKQVVLYNSNYTINIHTYVRTYIFILLIYLHLLYVLYVCVVHMYVLLCIPYIYVYVLCIHTPVLCTPA